MVCRCSSLQGEIHRPRFLPGCVRQPLISARAGQPVSFTRCGHGMNAGAAVSIHHGLDQLQLLPILFAKNSHLRLHQIEQSLHHPGHPSKMSWPMGILKTRLCGHARQLGRWYIDPIRVNVLFGGTPDHIGPRRFGQPRVHLEPARVPREIVLVVELIWIHKNAHHHGPAQTLGGTHQFQVTFVQPTHGWHKDAARERFQTCIFRQSCHEFSIVDQTNCQCLAGGWLEWWVFTNHDCTRHHHLF